MDQVVNIAAYKFVALNDLKERRRRLRKKCVRLELRGTILLSTEGINLFLAGSRTGIDKLLADLRSDPQLSDLQVKESLSEQQPFNRMLVRIKKEIIAFGVAGIEPAHCSSRKISPRELKQWLDEGRPLTLLDTRNRYETRLGTFANAHSMEIDHFREFPQAAGRLPADRKQQPLVMFCTGGIRCEKAGPFLEQSGFTDVLQLDGGILKYFEDCGGAHFDGDCFVFDQRVALDSELRETAAVLCFACQQPLTLEEQQSPHYVPGDSCPRCYQEPEERMRVSLRQRQARLDAAVDPLPGSTPYVNRRPLKVPQKCSGLPLLEFLTACLPHVDRHTWLQLLELKQLVTDDGTDRPADAMQIVEAGQRFFHLMPETIEPDVNASIEILYEDASIIVLNKPAPLPMHPSGRYNRNSLVHILSLAYAPQRPRVGHRLDANTTGVVVMSRTRQVASQLQPQFSRREVDKTYLVRVHGHPPQNRFQCAAPIDPTPGHAGVRGVAEQGQESLTLFETVVREPEGTALLKARPVTGRTNQIRIHLWHLGYPVAGDPLYLPGAAIGDRQTLQTGDEPLCLHAWQLGFRHPASGQAVRFEASLPPWATRHRAMLANSSTEPD